MPQVSLFAAPAPLKPSAWSLAERDVSSLIADLGAHIHGYSYADEGRARATDERVSLLLIGELRDTKHALFPLVDRAYKLSSRGAEGYHDFEHRARLLRDDLDILSDEIKMRNFSWTDIEPDWLKMLVRKDHELLAAMRKLQDSVLQLGIDLSHAERPEATSLADKGFWPALAAHTDHCRSLLGEVVKLFKERENICNLKKYEFAKTQAQMQRSARLL